MAQKYPAWVDEYAKAFHNAFAKMVPNSWGPLDAFALIAALNGSFIAKVHEAVQIVKAEGRLPEEVGKSFSSPSSLRAALYFLMWEYQNAEEKNREQFKEVVEFLVGVLEHMAERDTFAHSQNIAHSPEKIAAVLNDAEWQEANPAIAREIGKLYNSLASLVFALYTDFFPQDSHEIYGPYDASAKFGDGTILVMKHFPKIRPSEVWPVASAFKHYDAKIFQVFRDVRFNCEVVGMHSLYDGDIINSLAAYSVVIDGVARNDPAEIKALADHFASIATEIAVAREELSKEELKKKILELECYQFFVLFKLAGMDWRPTGEMLRLAETAVVPARFEMDQFPSFEEYATSPAFEAYWLKDLYQGS